MAKKKESEKTENMEWDEGFGELFENIKDRKAKKPFPTLEEINGWDKK